MNPCLISHNWPQEEFKVNIYAGITKITRAEPHGGGNGGGLRASVKNFTFASRKRLLEKMARCRNMDSGYFGTFTYPGHFTYTWQECKAHMAAFRKRLLRAYPEIRVIWRMEVKPRLSGKSIGVHVPHYHLLIFGLPYGHEARLQAEFGKMWNEIANNKTEDYEFLRSEVKQIRSRQHAVYYASKYAAKPDDGFDDGFGRHWGFFGEWDESESLVLFLRQHEVIELRRLIRKWLKSKGKAPLARMFARIRPDYGLSAFGLGDHDLLDSHRSLITDMLIAIGQ